MSLFQAGFGSFGQVRAAERDEMNLSAKRVKELEAGKQAFLSTHPKDAWTPGMEADFVEAKNEAFQRAIQAQMQYETGWQDRLVSEALNMPGSNRLFMTRFTRKEAAAAGIFAPPNFGGSEQQTRSWRDWFNKLAYPRYSAFQERGSGSPEYFLDRALASGRGDMSVGSGPGMSINGGSGVTVNVKIEARSDPGVTVRQTGQSIQHFQTAADFNSNGYQNRTPGG
jgi:hypothetical protein